MYYDGNRGAAHRAAERFWYEDVLSNTSPVEAARQISAEEAKKQEEIARIDKQLQEARDLVKQLKEDRDGLKNRQKELLARQEEIHRKFLPAASSSSTTELFGVYRRKRGGRLYWYAKWADETGLMHTKNFPIDGPEGLGEDTAKYRASFHRCQMQVEVHKAKSAKK